MVTVSFSEDVTQERHTGEQEKGAEDTQTSFNKRSRRLGFSTLRSNYSRDEAAMKPRHARAGSQSAGGQTVTFVQSVASGSSAQGLV